MTDFGIILYGPPAAGKSTTARALSEFGATPYRPIKHGRGRSAGYRMVNAEEIERLRHSGDVAWEQQRYGSVYVWLRSELQAAKHPVVELGQPEAVSTIINETDIAWTVAELTCPRPVAVDRISARDTGDHAERIAAWDATSSLMHADISINTSKVPPATAAAAIWSAAYDTPKPQIADTQEVRRKAP